MLLALFLPVDFHESTVLRKRRAALATISSASRLPNDPPMEPAISMISFQKLSLLTFWEGQTRRARV